VVRRIAIIGSRGFPSPERVESYVASLDTDCVVVSGGARGVDRWAEQAARGRGLDVVVFEADWQKLGAKAGPMRNQLIIAHADQVTAFWDRRSRGTVHTLVLAKEANLPVTILDADGNEVSMDEVMTAARQLGVLEAMEKARRRASKSQSR
jgi:predicted Rossmann fold nucleotide-binding protein DprA/Smf involved in DNA uptake